MFRWVPTHSDYTFLDYLAEVAGDRIIVGANEPLANMWAFSITGKQAESMRARDVLHFLAIVVEARERQILERYGWDHPMIFYCWFDHQAPQLRFSLISDWLERDGRLPFGCRLNLVQSLVSIIEQFLQSPYHDGVPIGTAQEEVAGTFEDDGAEDSQYVLDVWAKRLPTISSKIP